MRNKKSLLALTMASVMGLSTLVVPVDTVKAEEVVQEYVVMAKNDAGYDKVEETYGDEMTEESSVSEVLADNNIAVVELTETEAEKLEKDKNIIMVEEDILFEGSGSKNVNKKKKNKDKKDFGKADETEKKLALKKLRQESKVAVEAEKQWNIDAIHANEQKYTEASEQVKVAVMDTGVTPSEDIDVAGRINLIHGEEDIHPLYEDISGHGTAVASVIAAKENDMGITGVNPNVELYSVKVLDNHKTASLSRIVEGIYWCIENDIDIINMSFGTNVKSEILEQVVKEADEAGILMIAAAGNHGEETEENDVEYPAAFGEVLAVGATNSKGAVSEISITGEEVELVAPGEDIPATGYYGEVVKTEGTSMAAPHVTGAASVLWAKDRSKSSDFIRALLNASAVKVDDEDKTGNGMVDLAYALSVYDEFVAGYQENSDTNEGIVEVNPAEPEVYEEAEVRASWGTANHAYGVGLYGGMEATEMAVIKIGAQISDQSIYPELRQSDDESLNTFHGFGNYVANYMYVMRIAKICYTQGINKALANAVYPCSSTSKQGENIKSALNTFFSGHYLTALSGYGTGIKNQARLLVGIASHIAMDTYAHRAYIPNSNGKWTLITKESGLRDNTNTVRSRWTCAQDIAYDIMLVWDVGEQADAFEYYQPAHNKDEFHLHKFKTFVSESDPSMYSSASGWYTNRSAGD